MSTQRPRRPTGPEAIIRENCPDATTEEITGLLGKYKKVAQKLPEYVGSLARSNQIPADLETLRAEHHKSWLIREIGKLRQGPECPHGDRGGAALHPVNKVPLCPVCRSEAPPMDARQALEGEDDAAELPDAPEGNGLRLILTPASSIAPRPVRWGWDDRMPAGHVTLIPGREGIGKSLFLIDLTAKITRGTLPGIYHGTPRPVIYCATEDSWQHTIVPRLIAAGADLERVYQARIETTEVAGAAIELSLPRDCDILAAEIRSREVAMVALDPLMSVIDRHVDTYNDREMRTVLEPLARLADETGCMIAGLAHFNKSADTDPLNLVTGSRAFTAVVRSVVAIVRDPESDDGQCIVSQVKNNLGRLDLPNLTYVIRSAIVETEEGNASVGRLHFTGESARSVRDILADSGNPKERTLQAECADWLREQLAAGARPSSDIIKLAGEQGFSVRTLARARKRASIRTEERPTGEGGANQWWMSLPPDRDTAVSEPGVKVT